PRRAARRAKPSRSSALLQKAIRASSGRFAARDRRRRAPRVTPTKRSSLRELDELRRRLGWTYPGVPGRGLKNPLAIPTFAARTVASIAATVPIPAATFTALAARRTLP